MRARARVRVRVRITIHNLDFVAVVEGDADENGDQNNGNCHQLRGGFPRTVDFAEVGHRGVAIELGV